jgi:hypothetical protein
MLHITLQPELYQQVKDHCRRLDTPVTVWARRIFQEALERESD